MTNTEFRWMISRATSLLLLVLFTVPAWGAEYWATQTGAGAQDGTSLANAWPQGSIVYGGANAAGRGDTLYLCGTPSAPITATIAPSGIGAFDGTANADADIFIISGDATKCGGTQGYLDPTISHAINASGLPGVYMQDLTCNDALGSCFQQLLSSTSSCAVSGAYYCGLQRNLTCTGSGLTSGHCATIVASGNTNFPASAIPALLQENVTSYDGGGAACNIRMHATGAIQRNCKSYRDGSVTNVWGVYQAGITLNTGAANSGSGVTWATLSGGAAAARKVTQTTFGASTGATINDVYTPISATGVAGDLTPDGTCTGDSDCATDPGTWGQVGDTLYINIGTTPSSIAAVYVTYAWNESPVITQSYAEEFNDTFDGVGIGLDFGTRNGVIKRSESYRNPGRDFACGGGAINCTIQSSVGSGGTDANIRMGGGGNSTVENFSGAGSVKAVSARIKQGETLTLRNIATTASTLSVTDSDSGGNDGTLTTVTNAINVTFIGRDSITTSSSFRLAPGNSNIGAGTVGAKYDFDNKRCGNPSNIGAFCTIYQDTRSSYSIRTDY